MVTCHYCGDPMEAVDDVVPLQVSHVYTELAVTPGKNVQFDLLD
jgi:hypothetical protein